eukprot:TRINITY_DN26433_c0_g1_i1.p1 TRINITY_DN26433_c0_g1~~TRINITY_DN26433_c0_g1_i1.p1  ORF type:complete len:718 (+),score=88.63 TRINITY_DN26433_c0_g1_i1:53-2206(+)
MPRPDEASQAGRQQAGEEHLSFKKNAKACLDRAFEDMLKIHHRHARQQCLQFGGEMRMEVLRLRQRLQELDATGAEPMMPSPGKPQAARASKECPDNTEHPHSWIADLSEKEEKMLNLASLPCPERWLLLADRVIAQEKKPAEEAWALRSFWVKKRSDGFSAHGSSEVFNRTSQLAHNFTRVQNVGDVLSSENCLSWFIMSPHSRFRTFWAIVSLLCIVWDMMLIPLQASELGNLVPIADSVGLVIFAYWCVDLPLNFFVGIDEGVGVVDMRPAKILKSYLRTWFGIDLFLILVDICIFSVAAIIQTSGVSNTFSTMRIARALRLMRFLRLMRLQKSSETVDLLLAKFRSEYTVLMAKILSLTLKVVIVVHYIACLWYLLSTLDEENNWRTPYGYEQQELWGAYVMAVHWSLTQFSPATQNIAPRNFYERTFAIVIVFYAFLAFSSFLSSMTNAVNELRSIDAEKTKGRATIRKFFCEKKVSTDLWCRITMFCRAKNLHNRILKETEISTFMEIPESLRIKLHEELYMPSLQDARFLQGRDDTDKQLMIKICHLAITEERQGPKQDVFVEGVECHHVIAFFRGEAKYWSTSYDGPVCLSSAFEHGDWNGKRYLCELTLWTPWHHRGQLITTTTCAWMLFQCEALASIVAKEEGCHLFSYLATVGLLVLAEAENNENPTTDLGLSDEMMSRLTARANAFLKLNRKYAGGLTQAFSSPM